MKTVFPSAVHRLVFKSIRRVGYLFLVGTMACFLACHQPLLPEPTSQAMVFDVTANNQDLSTKSLIHTANELQTDCSPDGVDGSAGGNSIGVLSSLTHKGHTWFDVLESSRLYFKEGVWKCYDAEKSVKHYYWAHQANYRFSFYYPSSAFPSLPSDATDIHLSINTQALQEDLLLAHASVSTANELPQDAVPVLMDHALSALRITFEFDGYDDSDTLTACWLENDHAAGLATVGTLHYTPSQGSEARSYFTDLSAPMPRQAFYQWTCQDGIPFSTDGETVCKATAWTPTAGITSGQLFVRKDGWIMLLPQTLQGTDLFSNTQICFSTARFGSDVMRVRLPKSIATQEGTTSAFLAGHHYTIRVRIGQSSVAQGLTFEAAIFEEVENEMVFD